MCVGCTVELRANYYFYKAIAISIFTVATILKCFNYTNCNAFQFYGQSHKIGSGDRSERWHLTRRNN